MNIIVIVMDSLNFHSLSPYGPTPVSTPNMQRLADRSVVFRNHFCGSLPCMPARHELMTGRSSFLWSGWGDVEPWDRHIASQAAARGYATQIITDHYHYWEQSAHGYTEPFDGVEFVRGHEVDAWDTAPVSDPPEWVRSIDRHRDFPWRGRPGWGSLFYANARNYAEREERFPCAQVYQQSADWLTRNRDQQDFLLWVESFDPHEPFFVPEPYRTMYSPDGRDHPEFTCWPPYQNNAQRERFLATASDLELAWIRAQYQGKVTMVDHWLGKLLDRIDSEDRWRDTMVILTTDHGFELCDDRRMHSPYAKIWPHREAHARIPLMIAHPGSKPHAVDALTTAVDVCATLRQACGVTPSDGPDGRSLLPLVLGDQTSHRDEVLFGDFGSGVCLATADWILAQGSVAGQPLHWYSTTAQRVSADMTAGHFIPGVPIPQWRVPVPCTGSPSFLWRRHPFALTPEDRLHTEPEVASSMRDRLRAALRAATCPPETYQRLGLEL
jgi:arylsulfatase A-like enzyme